MAVATLQYRLGAFGWLALGDGGGERRPNGATLLKRRQLRAAGWALLPVPYWEWDALGSKAAKQAYLRAALEGLGRAVELGIDNVYAYLFLGRLYQENGRTDEALGFYQRVLTGSLRGTDGGVRAQVETYLAQADTDAARRLLDAHWPSD